MQIHELSICCTPYHPQQTSATPQRAPEFISVQCIGIKEVLEPLRVFSLKRSTAGAFAVTGDNVLCMLYHLFGEKKLQATLTKQDLSTS